MKEVNRSILRLIAAISSPEMVDDLELEPFVDADRRNDFQQERRIEPQNANEVDLEEMHSILRGVERKSIWSRFM